MKLRGKFLCWLAVMAVMVCVVVSIGCGGGGSSGGSVDGVDSEDVYVPDELNEPNSPDTSIPGNSDVVYEQDTQEESNVPDSQDKTGSQPYDDEPNNMTDEPVTPVEPDNSGREYTLSGLLNGTWRIVSGELTVEESKASLISGGRIVNKQVFNSYVADYVRSTFPPKYDDISNFDISVTKTANNEYRLDISADVEIYGDKRISSNMFWLDMRRRDNNELVSDGGVAMYIIQVASIVKGGKLIGNDIFLYGDNGEKKSQNQPYTALIYELVDSSTIEYSYEIFMVVDGNVDIGSNEWPVVVGDASLKLILKRVN